MAAPLTYRHAMDLFPPHPQHKKQTQPMTNPRHTYHWLSELGMLIGSSLLTRWGEALLKTTTRGDERNVEDIVRVMDEDDEVEDEEAIEAMLEGPEGPELPEHGRKRVRRGRKMAFVKKMAFWARVKFPNLLNQRTEADVACLRIALAKHMATMHVRNTDIVRLLPLIVAAAYLPTTDDVAVARAVATRSAEKMYSSHLGWKYPIGPAWARWLPWNRTRPTGLPPM